MNSPVARNILILGYGEMGRSMAQLLAPRHRLTIWQRPGPGRPAVDLEAAAARAEVVLFCVPGQAHFELAARLHPRLATHTLCLTVSKGLDESARLPVEALRDGLAGRGVPAVLYGPMIAEEIRAGRPAFALAGADVRSTGEMVVDLCHGSALGVSPATDLIGLSWCAVLKNPYAILFGLADGLSLGDNVRGWLATQAIAELSALLAAVGGDPASASGLAGLGDLITTATSSGSHHHELGREIARGSAGPFAGEGVRTLAALTRTARLDLAAHPLLALAADCLRAPARGAQRLRDCLERARG